MDVFTYSDYRKYIKDRITLLPKKHGQYTKLAAYIRIHSTLLSQIMSGSRNLTPEQACEVGQFFGLTTLESEHFVALVELENANSHLLKNLIEKRIEEIKKRSDQFKHRLSSSVTLNEENRALFYSEWYFSAIRLLTEIPHAQIPEEISKILNLPLKKVRETLKFLTEVKLCIEKEGLYQIGPTRTHIDNESPLISRHHTNWRVKAIENYANLDSQETAFTSPLTISIKDAEKIKQKLKQTILEIHKLVPDSKAETLYCLNIDWFKIDKKKVFDTSE